MKILTAAQIRQADQATIEQEKIESVELMERAARAFTAWFENKFLNRQPVYIFCGPGNNSVDGLAVARLLLQRNYTTAVYTLRAGATPSPDFTTNFNRLNELQQVVELKEEQDFPSVPADAVVIDALFGTGLNRPVSGLFGQLIRHINSHSTCTVAIDIPSGLFTDSQTPEEGAITEAAYTISFELPKLAFLLPQHYRYVGQWQVVPIGLSSQFIQDVQTNVYCVSPDMIAPLLQPRKPFSHKGTFGHVMLLAGSYGKMGAAVLATKACLRSGAGLVSVHVPQRGYDIIQTAAPEAMASVDKNRRHLSQLPDLENYTAVGAGPGLGQEPATKSAIGQLLATTDLPLVLDADALNIISSSERLKKAIPDNAILTPHPKEFERLTGEAKNDYHRLELLRTFCSTHSCFVVLKGRYTCTCTPSGSLYFNTTGNAGMATGGTGDVLTGIITALVAQHYSPAVACLLGVYLHGLAGDLAARAKGETALIASDIINYLGKAYKQAAGTTA